MKCKILQFHIYKFISSFKCNFQSTVLLTEGLHLSDLHLSPCNVTLMWVFICNSVKEEIYVLHFQHASKNIDTFLESWLHVPSDKLHLHHWPAHPHEHSNIFQSSITEMWMSITDVIQRKWIVCVPACMRRIVLKL